MQKAAKNFAAFFHVENVEVFIFFEVHRANLFPA